MLWEFGVGDTGFEEGVRVGGLLFLCFDVLGMSFGGLLEDFKS